ncbi:MAG: PaeR7I family type II restriction endonuclease [Blastocatellia bacterium]
MEIETLFEGLDDKLRAAIQYFWDARIAQQNKQKDKGTQDKGTRSEVTGGGHMVALERLVSEILSSTGLPDLSITIGKAEDVETKKSKRQLELPGYYRPEKQWDMIVISRGQLVAAIEFKSHIGPSFGNNANNRAEEAIGNAEDIWKAYREERFGKGPQPFLGYLLLLEDCDKVHTPGCPREPFFPVDPIFKDGPIETGKGKRKKVKYDAMSYSRRYMILCRRLKLERFYTSTCLLLATRGMDTRITEPTEDLSFRSFLAALIGHAQTFILSMPETKGTKYETTNQTRIKIKG